MESPRPAAPRAVLLGAALALVIGSGLLIVAAPSLAQSEPTDDRGAVIRTGVDGAITPVTRDRLDAVITRAERRGARAVVVTLDTPGGLLDATRDIVQRFLGAEVPIIVHVAPPGADAGSAGTFITYAAHVAAMAPATTIGAATPVDLEGGAVGDKVVENTVAFAEAIAEARGRDVDFAVAAVRDGRSVTASTALEAGAIDHLAADVDELLALIDGTRVELPSGPRILDTAGASVEDDDPTAMQSLLQLLADPNLAFVFLSLGSLAILYEIASPGLGLGGVVGVIALVLAMFSLSVLPVQTAGLILLVVAAVMFIAELFIPGVGVGAAGGTGALVLGGLFLFQSGTGIAVDWWVLVPTAVVTFGATAVAGVLAARSRRVEPVEGADDLIGHVGRVRDVDRDHPRVAVYGAYWRVRPQKGQQLREGQRVRVIARDNLDLIVEDADGRVSAPAPPSPRPRTR